MNSIEAHEVRRPQVQNVGLVELERIARLGPDVHPHHLKARPVVTDCAATGSTKQVEQSRTTHYAATPSRICRTRRNCSRLGSDKNGQRDCIVATTLPFVMKMRYSGLRVAVRGD